MNPEKSLQVAPGWNNQIFGVNEKLFKDPKSARIAESVVTGLTGALNPKSVLSAGKAVKDVAKAIKLPSRNFIKEMILPRSKMTGYDWSVVMHELGRTRPTNILEDILYDPSDWSGFSSSLSSNSSRSSLSSNGSFSRGWNFHSDYKPVPVTDLPDYMRLKPGVHNPTFKPVDDPYVKLPNVARKVVGGFQNDDQKVCRLLLMN